MDWMACRAREKERLRQLYSLPLGDMDVVLICPPEKAAECGLGEEVVSVIWARGKR